MMGDLGVAAQTTAVQEEVQEVEETVEEPIEDVQEEVEPEPEIVTEPEPVEVKQKSPIEVKKPEPKPEPKPNPKPKSKPEPKPELKPVVKSAPKPIAPPSMANQKATTGRADSASSGGNPGAKASYFSQLKSVLAQNKRYPRASLRRNEEGVVSLSFVAHADGSVSDVKITQSSGHRRLDNAVLDMIKRSTPLPHFTKGMVESELRINLPVSFKLSDLR
jgi:protein TonB